MKKIFTIFLTVIILIVMSSTLFIVSAQVINSPIATCPTETKYVQNATSVIVDNGAISPQTEDPGLWVYIAPFVTVLFCLFIVLIIFWASYKFCKKL